MNILQDKLSDSDLDFYLHLLSLSHEEKHFLVNDFIYNCNYDTLEFIYTLNHQFKIDFTFYKNLFLSTCLLSVNSPLFNLEKQKLILDLLLNKIKLNPLDSIHTDIFCGPIGIALSSNHTDISNTILPYYKKIDDFKKILNVVTQSTQFLYNSFNQPLDNLNLLFSHPSAKFYKLSSSELYTVKNIYSQFNSNIPKQLHISNNITSKKTINKKNINPFLSKFYKH